MTWGSDMADATYVFSHQELVELLVKAQGLHEGLWSLAITFGFGAAHMGSSATAEDMNPAAIVQVQHIGLQRVTERTSLSVDAAEVNPLPPAQPAELAR
jgi:hypothetical protein